MNQSFEIKELRRLCKQNEYIENSLSVTSLEAMLTPICEDILNETFNFNIKQIGSYFLTETLENKLILRKLNDNIKRLYKAEQANRRIIISQIKVLLEETCPCWIIKTDIKKFYESIDRNKLLLKFKDDSMLSHYSMFLLNKLFSNITISLSTGVPRGMNISATLSEIYMRKFDRWIRESEGVFFYARFVDDIIIFINTLFDAKYIIENIDIKLKELASGLTINQEKTQLFNGLIIEQINIKGENENNKKSFLEYLGYRFAKNQKELLITIADKKIKKMKTRITFSFLDFIKNNNFNLLNNRILFLTGNYGIKKTAEGNTLKSGIFFNYPNLNNKMQLIELTTFYRRILFCKRGKIGMALARLSLGQRNKLKKYNFVDGFNKRIYKYFSFSKMKEIVGIW